MITAAKPSDSRRPAVLRLLLEIPETNAPYQQLSLPLAREQRITLCTYFPAAMKVPPEIALFEGNGTLRGYFAVLRRALRADSHDIIHAHTPHVAIAFLAATWWRPRLQRATVFTVHSCYENHKLRNRLMLLPVFAFFRRVVCCSQSSFESFPWYYRWLAGRRFCCIPNGVHTQRIDAARTDELSRGVAPFTVTSVGRLVPVKNLSAAVDAFGLVGDSDIRMMVVGDGPERKSLVAQSQHLGLEDRVHFSGLLDRDEVYRRLMHSDLFVSTSFGEGLPVAVLEAMACGCPVVLSDIAPHREIAEGVDFIPLVPPSDTRGFAREIARFQQMSPCQREEISRACARLVRDRFSLEAMHAGYNGIYEELMTGSRS